METLVYCTRFIRDHCHPPTASRNKFWRPEATYHPELEHHYQHEKQIAAERLNLTIWLDLGPGYTEIREYSIQYCELQARAIAVKFQPSPSYAT